MANIIVPQEATRTLSEETVSKRQLAEIVNAQSRQIKLLQDQRQQMLRLLAAIVAEPDALTSTGQDEAELDWRVYETPRLKRGSFVKMRRVGDTLQIRARHSDHTMILDPLHIGLTPGRMM